VRDPTYYCALCGCWALEQTEGFCSSCYEEINKENQVNTCRHQDKADGPRCGLPADLLFEFGESDKVMLSAPMCSHHATMQYFALTDELRLELGRRVFVPGMGAWMCVSPLDWNGPHHQTKASR
jgi:hypothetical protein